MEIFNYCVVSSEFEVTFYMPYKEYHDITRYYNIGNELHSHECIKTHHTLAVF